MNLGRIDVADALRRVAANKAKKQARATPITTEASVFGSRVAIPAAKPTSYEATGQRRSSLASSVLAQVGGSPMMLKPPPGAARYKTAAEVAQPYGTGPEFAPQHTKARQTVGTLEHAMAQVDAEFPGLTPEARDAIKYHLQAVSRTNAGARAELDRKSLLDLSPELEVARLKQERPSSFIAPHIPGGLSEESQAVVDAPGRFMQGQQLGVAMTANTVLGALMEGKPDKLKELVPQNPLDKKLGRYERAQGTLDYLMIAMGLGAGIRGGLRSRAGRKAGVIPPTPGMESPPSPTGVPTEPVRPVGVPQAEGAPMPPTVRKVAKTVPVPDPKAPTKPKTPKKNQAAPEPADTHRAGDRVALYHPDSEQTITGEITDVRPTGVTIRVGKETFDAKNGPQIHNLDNARFDARERPPALKSAYEEAGRNKNAFRADLEEPKAMPREGDPVPAAPQAPKKGAKKTSGTMPTMEETPDLLGTDHNELTGNQRAQKIEQERAAGHSKKYRLPNQNMNDHLDVWNEDDFGPAPEGTVHGKLWVGELTPTQAMEIASRAEYYKTFKGTWDYADNKWIVDSAIRTLESLRRQGFDIDAKNPTPQPTKKLTLKDVPKMIEETNATIKETQARIDRGNQIIEAETNRRASESKKRAAKGSTVETPLIEVPPESASIAEPSTKTPKKSGAFRAPAEDIAELSTHKSRGEGRGRNTVSVWRGKDGGYLVENQMAGTRQQVSDYLAEKYNVETSADFEAFADKTDARYQPDLHRQIDRSHAPRPGMEPDFGSSSRGYPEKGEPGSMHVETKPITVGKLGGKKTSVNELRISAYDEKGDIVGTFGGYTDGPNKGAFTVTVRPDAQKKGVGTRLLSEADKAGFDIKGSIGANRFTPEGRKLMHRYVDQLDPKSRTNDLNNRSDQTPDTLDLAPEQPLIERPQHSEPTVHSPRSGTTFKVKVLQAHGDGTYTVRFPREAGMSNPEVRVSENPTNPEAPRITGVSERLAKKGLAPKRASKGAGRLVQKGASKRSGAVDPKTLAKVTAAAAVAVPAVAYGIKQAQEGNPGVLEIEAALLASAVLARPVRAVLANRGVSLPKPQTVAWWQLGTRGVNELGTGVIRDVGKKVVDAANLAVWRSGKLNLELGKAIREATGKKNWHKDPEVKAALENIREVIESQSGENPIEPTPMQKKIIEGWTKVHEKIPQHAWELGIGIEQNLDKSSAFGLKEGDAIRLAPGGIEYKVIQVRDPKTGRFDVKLMRADGSNIRASWAEGLAEDRATALEYFKTPEAKADFIEAVKRQNMETAADIRERFSQEQAERAEEGLGPLPDKHLEERIKRATQDPEKAYELAVKKKSLLTDVGQLDVRELSWGERFYRKIKELGGKYFPRMLKPEVIDMINKDELFRKQMAAENVFLNPEYYGLDVDANVWDTIQQLYPDMRELGEALAKDATPDSIKGLVRGGDPAAAYRNAIDDLKQIGESLQGTKDPVSYAAQLERERRLRFATEHYEADFERATSQYFDRVSKRMAVAEVFGTGDPQVVARHLEYVRNIDPQMADVYTESLARMLGFGESKVATFLTKASHYEGAYAVLSHLFGSKTILLRQLTDLFFPLIREGGVTTAQGLAERIRQARASRKGETVDLDYRHSAAAHKYFTRELDGNVKALGLERGIATTATDAVMQWIGVQEMDGQVKAATHAVGQLGAEKSLRDLAFADAPKKGVKKLVGRDAAGIARKAEKYTFGADDATAVREASEKAVQAAEAELGRPLTPKEVELIRSEKVRSHILSTEMKVSQVHGAITRDLTYSGASRDIPYLWSHPIMRIVGRFKGPALMATRFLVRDVFTEALHGNVAPMTRLLAVGGTVGYPIAKIIQGFTKQDQKSFEEAWKEGGLMAALGTAARNVYDIGLLGWLGEVSPYNPGAYDKEGEFQLYRVARPPAVGSIENIFEMGARIMRGVRSSFGDTQEVDYPGEEIKAAISDFAQREFAWYKNFVQATGVEPALSKLNKLERQERKGQMDPFSDEAYEAADLKARFPVIPKEEGESQPRPITETLRSMGLTRTGNPPKTRKKRGGSFRRPSPSRL